MMGTSVVLLLAQAAAMSAAQPQMVFIEREGGVGVENAHCRILFDGANGSLLGIANIPLNDECLKGAERGQSPFRIYLDLVKEYELGDSLVEISKKVIRPADCRVKYVRKENGLGLTYEGDGLEMALGVILEGQSGTSDWSFAVKNTGQQARTFLPSFPFFGGVRLGADPAGNWATVLNQAGSTGPAWKYQGGVFGNGGQFSMQWHAVWDPATHSAFGVIFMDPDAKAKQLMLHQPNLELNYFPPVTLEPGASLRLPSVRLMVYEGDWRPAARAYRAWYDTAYQHAPLPQWFKDSDACEGRHLKKAGPGVKADYGGQFVLDSFRDMPRAHLRLPIDNMEYAYYSRGSMLYGKHTDGDNIIREDLGGAEAMHDGIAGVHRLGLHVTLYVEGYIVYRESDLAKSGKAERWPVMHKDGSITGPYTRDGFYHMCPGCTDWQDHLAATAARLLRETGADGIRLDSLGFYFLPCYNPAHNHSSPFSYNEWMKQLLSKVRAAALAVNPDALLTTEAPVDWYGQWFHGALTQVYPRDLPLMRLAVGPYRAIAYAQSGPVWGSVSGLAGGRSCWEADLERLEGNWLCARCPVHEALAAGDVADIDPVSSDSRIVTRQFRGKGYWAVVAARPACSDSSWPAYGKLSDERGEYTLTLSGLGSGKNDAGTAPAALCDIETLTWTPVQLERKGTNLLAPLSANWSLIIVPDPDGPALVDFAPLPVLHAGDSAVIHVTALTVKARAAALTVSIAAPGLKAPSAPVAVPGEVAVAVPSDAMPGLYAIEVVGENTLASKRFLKVE